MLKTDPGETQRHTGVLVAIGLLTLVFGFTLALTLPAYVGSANPFWFVGLLVILGGSLALMAVVFSWLGLASRDEAFALPSGSVRTLLAVGVMVLFTVFGLASISVSDSSYMSRASDQPMATAVAPAASAALDAEIRRYERQGIVAVVETVDGPTATLKLHRVERVKPAETSDMQKQLITALVTLLTSVVSFYFGSRTVESARDSKSRDKDPPANAAPGTEPVDLKALGASIDDGARRLTALQSEPASAGNEAALATVLAALVADLPGLRDDRTKLEASLAYPPKGSTAPADQAAALTQRVEAFGQRLTQAEALVAKG